MSPIIAFGFLGLIVNRAVDFLRNAFDKHDRFPKAGWVVIAWGLGVVLGLVICAVDSLSKFFGVHPGSGCADAVLLGLGYGSIGGFWHEALSFLSSFSGTATTPKGLTPGRGRTGTQS